MRVQTNGLPDHCYAVTDSQRVTSKVIDFVVKYNLAAAAPFTTFAS
jgi:hypothetical protein